MCLMYACCTTSGNGQDGKSFCHVLTAYQCRRASQLRASARKAGQEYIDKAFMRGRFPSALPRTLTARNGQLTPQQQYVYDDFARIPRTAPKEGEPASSVHRSSRSLFERLYGPTDTARLCIWFNGHCSIGRI